MSEPLTVLYDADCGLCTWSARLLHRLDRNRQLRLMRLASASMPGQPTLDTLRESLHAVDSAGQWWVGADACLEIARRLPIFSPLTRLAVVPLVWKHLELAYQLISRHRHLLTAVLGLEACASSRSRGADATGGGDRPR